jgi:site-specific DNA recombinase
MGIPPSYTRAGRSVTRGKRTTQTAGIWRAGRIRNMLANSTYKGIHTYGKRSQRERELIERPVPQIVTEEIWNQAQRTLTRNAWASPRNSKRDYLLRGLIRCGRCGLSYTGASWTNTSGEVRSYYTCNGRAQYRGIYGAQGEKCPSRAVSGKLEDLVWNDIITFAMDAEPILEELRQENASEAAQTEALQHEAKDPSHRLSGFASQRDRILSLYRRGSIGDTLVDRQLAAIEAEREAVARSLEQVLARLESNEAREGRLDGAGVTIHWLLECLDNKRMPLDFAIKREVVEELVDRIVIETVEEDGKQEQVARVTYAFTPIADRRDTGSWPRSAQKHHTRPPGTPFAPVAPLPERRRRSGATPTAAHRLNVITLGR